MTSKSMLIFFLGLALVGLSLVMFAGCEQEDAMVQKIAPLNYVRYVCSPNGVQYLHSHNSGVVVSVDREGKPVKCEQ